MAVKASSPTSADQVVNEFFDEFFKVFCAVSHLGSATLVAFGRDIGSKRDVVPKSWQGETLYNAAMYLRKCGQSKVRKDGVYWELVESCRTERGPRQRVVAYLGDLDQAARVGVRNAALNQPGCSQVELFAENAEP